MAGVSAALPPAAVGLLTLANLRGVTRVLFAVTATVLVGFAGLIWTLGPTTDPDPLPMTGGPGSVLEAAGLLFFAFAGYARIATLAEEVRRPKMIAAVGARTVSAAPVRVLTALPTCQPQTAKLAKTASSRRSAPPG